VLLQAAGSDLALGVSIWAICSLSGPSSSRVGVRYMHGTSLCSQLSWATLSRESDANKLHKHSSSIISFAAVGIVG
jgi:hypothetical protein